MLKKVWLLIKGLLRSTEVWVMCAMEAEIKSSVFSSPTVTPSPHGTRAPAASPNQRVFLGEVVFCNYFVFYIFTSA